MTENQISAIVVNLCYEIHVSLGPGLLESIYEQILFQELIDKGLFVEKQKSIPVFWKTKKLDYGFRADLIINKKVIVEIKSIESLAPVHFKQVLTYLKVTGIKLGLLVNFNENYLKNGIRRVVNNL